MEGAKEQFLEQREWMVVMDDYTYCSLPYATKQSFKTERVQYANEHKTLWENDSTYRELYKTYRAAKKDMEEYKFNKRHGSK